jgi:hypothetical protein
MWNDINCRDDLIRKLFYSYQEAADFIEAYRKSFNDVKPKESFSITEMPL